MIIMSIILQFFFFWKDKRNWRSAICYNNFNNLPSQLAVVGIFLSARSYWNFLMLWLSDLMIIKQRSVILSLSKNQINITLVNTILDGKKQNTFFSWFHAADSENDLNLFYSLLPFLLFCSYSFWGKKRSIYDLGWSENLLKDHRNPSIFNWAEHFIPVT